MRRSSLSAPGALALAALLASAPVRDCRAGDAAPAPAPVAPSATHTDAEQRSLARGGLASGETVAWRAEWPRVRPWEYAATAAFLAIGLSFRFVGPTVPDNWRGGILFDGAVQRALAIDDPQTARTLETITDRLFQGAIVYRLVDSAAVPLIGYGDADLALQMSMIDLSAFSVQALVLWGSQVLVGRTRPIVLRCSGQDAMLDERCAISSRLAPRRSFIAGHAASGITAAGLTCLHHARIPLYGGWGDGAACGATIVAAAVNSYGRVATESHYATDLVFAVGLGLLSGWVLPAALHYGFDDAASPGEGVVKQGRGARGVLLPSVQQDEVGVVAIGVF